MSLHWPVQAHPPVFPVLMKTYIEDDGVQYEVRVSFNGGGFEEGENEVMVYEDHVNFGANLASRAGGEAFTYAARRQQNVADLWVQAIKEGSWTR